MRNYRFASGRLRKSARGIVVVEGETEMDYIQRLQHHLRIKEPVITVKKSEGGDLPTCLRCLREEIKSQQRKKEFNPSAGDKAFIVSDIREHLLVDGDFSMDLKEKANISFQEIRSTPYIMLAVNEPCFEYFLTLHLEATTSPGDQDFYFNKLKNLPGWEDYSKRITMNYFDEFLAPNFLTARDRSKEYFDDRISNDGSEFWLMENPNSSMFNLIDFMMKISQRHNR